MTKLHGRTLAIAVLFFSLFKLYAFEQLGTASWYGGKFHGRKTANGEIYDSYSYTAAHKTLPFGTMITVNNLENGLTVQVRINDRGPFVDNRIIDLSYLAAKEIDMVKNGTAKVKILSTEDGIPETIFNIQIGAWSDFNRALMHRKKLESAGLKPRAVLTSKGITRIEIPEVTESEAQEIVAGIEALGYKNLFIYQVHKKKA